MEQVVAVKADEAEDKINSYLNDGWKVKKVIAEHVGVSTGNTISHMKSCGLIIFVLQKLK